jgi:hypothetical protein
MDTNKHSTRGLYDYNTLYGFFSLILLVYSIAGRWKFCFILIQQGTSVTFAIDNFDIRNVSDIGYLLKKFVTVSSVRLVARTLPPVSGSVAQ